MQRFSAFSMRPRVFAVATAALVLGFLPATPAGASGPAAIDTRPPTLNTRTDWNGSDYIWPFGCPDTSTYGQVITVQKGNTRLTRFNFYMSDQGHAGSLVMRGEVYAWDGSKATGDALWESHPRTVDYQDDAFHRKQFRPHGIVELQSGAQYVIFASISKDYEQCADNYTVVWGGFASDDPYQGGAFVYLNDSGDESQWTTTNWSSFGDLAFKAWLS